MTNTEICNLALSMIGQGSISDIYEESEQARQCKLWYDQLRKQLLSKFVWGFAHKYQKLAEVDEKIPRYDFVYEYPEDCLSMKAIYNDITTQDIDTKHQEYEVANVGGKKCIACNLGKASIEYTADIKDAEIFTATFCSVLAHLIASSIALPLSGSANMANMQLQLAHQELLQAEVESARERENKPSYPHKYFDARF